jgi:hypothetical protein
MKLSPQNNKFCCNFGEITKIDVYVSTLTDIYQRKKSAESVQTVYNKNKRSSVNFECGTSVFKRSCRFQS